VKLLLADRVRAWREQLSHPVVAVGLGMIAVQLIFRAWASFNGWFYVDDFEFLTKATGRDLSWRYLLTPHDSQFMPGGILASWVVAHTGAFNWPAAATILLALQLLASSLCLALLCRLFGKRWWCLAVLGFYLFSTMTLTAFMWWAAAINQLPCQAAFFAALLLHANYLGTGKKRYAAAAALTIALGLCFYVKTALIIVVLVLFTLLYATSPAGPVHRIRNLFSRFWPAWLMYVPPVAAYAAFYVTNVPTPFAGEQSIRYLDVLDTMLRVSLGTTLVGGPWEWTNLNPPVAIVATPDWAVTASWIGIVLWCAAMLRNGRGDWRALLIAGAYLSVSYLLVARGRGIAGGFAGRELRYLADAAPVLTLCIGLFAMRMVLPMNNQPPPTPRPRGSSRSLAPTVGVLAALAVGAAYSNVQYARFWTGSFPAKTFTQTVQDESTREVLVLVDEPVPPLVMPSLSFPSNLPSRMFKPLGDRVQARTVGNDLSMLDSSGRAWPAVVSGGAVSLPGPAEDCGYALRSVPTTIDFDGAPQDFFWWMQISYLSEDSGEIELSIGDEHRSLDVRPGLHRLLVQGSGSIEDVTLRVRTAGGVCVDRVNVGNVAPLEPL
jgi:hypothetical protein